ncbi:restriction endonuclease subunit S [Streptomyces sp. NPDC057428]|uniref:restriction endonuclease subunit S n=1 Tax=Streptomyces sp. NPDC057428 TaxID=3346129 RepID=UPI00368AD2C6
MSTVRLRHLAQINPLTPAFDRLADEDELTFIPMEAVWPGNRLNISRRRTKSTVATGYTRFQNGDVLVPKITPTFEAGRAVLIDGLLGGVGAGTTELHIVRPGPEIDPKYLLYTVNTHNFLKLGAAEMYGVAGQQRVPDSFLRDLPVRLPPLVEQRRIAEYLDAETTRIDQLSASRRQQISALNERELAVIAEMLSGGATQDNGQPTGWPWLPHIPTDWRIGPLYAYYLTELGKMLNSDRASGDRQLPYLRNANVHWYEIDSSDMATMHFGPAEAQRYSVKAGDLLVCEGGAGVAEAAVWDGRIGDCYFQKSLHRVRQDGPLPVEWLMFWLRFAKSCGVFEADGNIATIPHLTGEQLREYRIPIPNDARARVAKTLRALTAMGDARTHLKQAQTLLAERRQALITAAVTGQFDVSTASGRNVTDGVPT